MANVLFVIVKALHISIVLLENPLSNSQVTKVSLVLVYPVNKCV